MILVIRVLVAVIAPIAVRRQVLDFMLVRWVKYGGW